MDFWDPPAARRLETLRAAVEASGVAALIQEAAAETWRANRDRHEPDALFDDASTLGYLSAKNLANRLHHAVHDLGRLREQGVSASLEFSAVVLHLPEADLRLVKAPVAAERRPDLRAHFDWNSSPSRLSAALRNADAFRAPLVQPGMEPLFLVDPPDAARALERCRDLFVVWGAELDSDLTAGWLGLPTIGPDRWLAATGLWWDQAAEGAPPVSADGPAAGRGFDELPPPRPVVRLKPRPLRPAR